MWYNDSYEKHFCSKNKFVNTFIFPPINYVATIIPPNLLTKKQCHIQYYPEAYNIQCYVHSRYSKPFFYHIAVYGLQAPKTLCELKMYRPIALHSQEYKLKHKGRQYYIFQNQQRVNKMVCIQKCDKQASSTLFLRSIKAGISSNYLK
jgi:hypothetical protein